MRGESEAMRLSAAQLLFLSQISRKFADNSSMKRRSRGRRVFKSTPLHHPVSLFSDLWENRSKSPRMRAIRDRAWTRRMPPAGLIAKIRRNLSGRDLARSADHSHSFRLRFLNGRSDKREFRIFLRLHLRRALAPALLAAPAQGPFPGFGWPDTRLNQWPKARAAWKRALEDHRYINRYEALRVYGFPVQL